MATAVSFSEVWRRIEAHTGEEFSQIRGKKFKYEVMHCAVIPSTTNQNIGPGQF